MFFNADDTSNGRKVNVSEIIGHLRSIEYKFSNDRIHEIIANLDGVIIKRTGDSKGSTKEYELITDPKESDHAKYEQILQESEDENTTMEKISAQMELYVIIYNKLANIDPDDSAGMDVLLQDTCLLYEMVERQKKAIKNTGEKSSSFQNAKNELSGFADFLLRQIRIAAQSKPNILRYKKQFEEFEDDNYLNIEFQKRFLFHVENPE